MDAGICESPAVGTGNVDRKAHTAVIKPASVTAVQLGEFPRSVQLPDFGDGSPVVAAGLSGFLEIHVAPDEIDPAWAEEQRGKKQKQEMMLRELESMHKGFSYDLAGLL